MAANDKQVGGDHYKKHGATGEQHWDRVHRLELDYFQGQITKYVERWRDKNGVQDLEKAAHFLAKYIELHQVKMEHECPGCGSRDAGTRNYVGEHPLVECQHSWHHSWHQGHAPVAGGKRE